MNWKYNTSRFVPADPPPTIFMESEILEVTDEDVASYLNFRAYGKVKPTAFDNPTHARSGSLQQYKKAISHFMLNKNMTWNEVTKQGNPTRSTKVAEVFKRITKKETSKQGAPSKKRRPMQPKEFEEVISMLEEELPHHKAYFASAYFRYQLNMIARLDDTAKLRWDTFERNENSVYAINTRLCWSKNVQTEDDAPPQILVGARDSKYCPLLGLALWIEYSLEKGGMETLVFEIDGMKNPKAIKTKAAGFLNDVLKSTKFKDRVCDYAMQGPLGSHSIRKFGTTKARRGGGQKDDVDYRARWKKRKRQQDDYTDEHLPLPDAVVAFSLCQGGAIGYKVIKESGITDEWILTYVNPWTARRFSNPGEKNVALVLGKALLWKIFADKDSYVPKEVSSRVKNAYRDINTSRRSLADGENPILRVNLQIFKGDNDTHLVIDEAEDDGNGTSEGRINPLREEIRFLSSQILALRRELNESKMENMRSFETQRQCSRIVNRNICAIQTKVNNLSRNIEAQGQGQGQRQRQRQQVQRIANEEEVFTGVDRNAKLSRRPKDAITLWNEYQHGLDGSKPARLFTRSERGQVKHVHFKRKILWDKVSTLVNGGWTAEAACQKIHDIYGRNEPMTKILDAMRKDEKERGGHPELRIANV